MKKNKFKKSELGLIPIDWEVKKIDEVAIIVGGGTPSTKIKEYWNGNVAWLTPKDLSNYKYKYIFKGNRNISELGLKNSSAKLIPKNSVLLTTRAPIGYLAIAAKQLSTNQGFKTLIVKANQTTSDFLYYLLKSKTKYLKSQAVGSTFSELSATSLKKLIFIFPPLSKQKAIAKILSDLDSKIEVLQIQNETLEEIGQTIFKHWFVDFEFPNEKGKPYKSSGGKMIDSELGKIPEGWEIRKLGDYIQPIKGKNITKAQVVNGKYPVIAGGLKPSCYHNQANTQAPVITISASGANAGFINLHHQQVWASDSSYIDSSITPYVYFYYFFLKYNQTIITDKQEGSAQPHIYPRHLMELNILNYPKDLLEKFVRFCNSIFKIIKNNNKQIQTLQRTRDLLLPQLMTGKIRVPLKK